MRPADLAREFDVEAIDVRRFLRRAYPRSAAEHGTAWHLTPDQVEAVRRHFSEHADRPAGRPAAGPRPARARAAADEAYVVDLCDEILGERARRQHRFDWLRGDPDAAGVARRLPVDAYYPDHGIVVEYRERQHDEPVPFFDRRTTISGVGRREQRRCYDERREHLIPLHGLRLVVVKASDLDADPRGRLRRNRDADSCHLRSALDGTAER